MPNWVNNIIKTSNKEALKFTINENGDFDFNSLIPMAEELNIECSSRTDTAIAYCKTDKFTQPITRDIIDYLNGDKQYIWSPDNIKPKSDEYYASAIETLTDRLKVQMEFSNFNPDEFHKMGQQYISNMEKYGHFTWYEWAWDKWGTKWNACDSSVYLDDDDVFTEFNTAWGAPMPVFKELCKRLPDVDMQFDIWFMEEPNAPQFILENDHGELKLIEKNHFDYETEETIDDEIDPIKDMEYLCG